MKVNKHRLFKTCNVVKVYCNEVTHQGREKIDGGVPGSHSLEGNGSQVIDHTHISEHWFPKSNLECSYQKGRGMDKGQPTTYVKNI